MQSAHAHALQIYKNVKICTFFLKTHKTSQIGLYVGKTYLSTFNPKDPFQFRVKSPLRCTLLFQNFTTLWRCRPSEWEPAPGLFSPEAALALENENVKFEDLNEGFFGEGNAEICARKSNVAHSQQMYCGVAHSSKLGLINLFLHLFLWGWYFQIT